mgnify:FL=1
MSEALIAERGKTHGDFSTRAGTAQALKEVMSRGANWDDLPPSQREALDMIAVKVSRILHGDPSLADHWDDIAGYALLGRG